MQSNDHLGISTFVSPSDEFFTYFDPESVESYTLALSDLNFYIATEGPFDGIVAFSQGAGLAASLMIDYDQNKKPQPFKVAIFFSGGVPTRVTHGEICMLDKGNEGVLISLPTAHIWGKHDREYPTFGPVLSKLCAQEVGKSVVWEGGHEIPGLRDKLALEEAVAAIRETIGRAS